MHSSFLAFSDAPDDMSLRYAPADEVRILTGGVDLFSVLYARAAEAYPRGIWVEAFGVVRGASIIELAGDRHRESVREATLSQMSATVFHDGESPDIRSVATLTWREKRAPQSLTGFLASALASHVTLRIREIELTDGTERSVTPAAERDTSSKKGRVVATQRSNAPAKTKTTANPREILREASTREEVDAAVLTLAEQNKRKRGVVQEKVVDSWEALAAEETPAAVEAPTLSWGDLEAAQNDAPSAAKSQKAAPKAKESAAPAQPLLDESWGSWDEVAQVSAEVALRPKTAASTLKRGEVLVHPTLGNCTIMAVVSESVVMVKPKHDTSRKISLKPFEIYSSGKAGIYELERRA